MLMTKSEISLFKNIIVKMLRTGLAKVFDKVIPLTGLY